MDPLRPLGLQSLIESGILKRRVVDLSGGSASVLDVYLRSAGSFRTVIDERLLEILVCPSDRTPLSLADDQLLSDLNRTISAGRVRNRGGGVVDGPLQGGLVREDGSLLYPVVDDIPVLLADEAIRLDQLGQEGKPGNG